jgi:hypothetical protein
MSAKPDLLVEPLTDERPRVRGDCAEGARPCPWIGCRHNLYLDVNEETGTVKLNFPDLEPWEMTDSCSLDVGDQGGATLEEVGNLLQLTRERVRQIESFALVQLRIGRRVRQIY